MNWKEYYQKELISEKGLEHISKCIKSYPSGDPKLHAIFKSGGAISFPHTSIMHSGNILARIITTLYQGNYDAIVSLGVLHSIALSKPLKKSYFKLIQKMRSGKNDDKTKEVFQQFSGPFCLSGTSIKTSFGNHPVYSSDLDIPRNDELLSGEYSLDTFHSLLAWYAQKNNKTPIPVLPVYVGLVRDLEGTFTIAKNIAKQLQKIKNKKIAIVSTGDLVHYGTTYTNPEDMFGMSEKHKELEEYFYEKLSSAFKLATRSQNYQKFYEISHKELKNDYREILPVVLEYLGEKATFEILEFRLSDYSDILEKAKPCLVASALVGFTEE